MTAAPPPPAPPLPPELRPLQPGDPALIGPYRVVGRLGQGGMGTVFGALDAQDRCTAVKVVHARFADDPDFRARFAREVALMRQVGGVCTAAVHAADATAPQPWVATDFVPGPTLHRHVRQHGPLSEEMLLAFAAGTAESLAAIHDAGVVHCDLKPGNVILAPEGPKVLDFGIARHVTEAFDGTVYGSPGWVSPERYDRQPPTPASDMFSWAEMVAFAATGRHPFGSGTPAELAERTRNAPADLDGVPEVLLPLLERALAKDPAVRPTAEAAFREVMALMGDAEEEIALESAPSLAARLRLRLGERWRGIDASWHRPALWVAALSATGLATSSMAAGTGAVGAGIAGAGIAAGPGAAGVGAAGAAGTGLAGAGSALAGGAGMAGAGAGTAAAAAGAGKVAVFAAAAVIGTAAAVTGGYLAVDALGGPGGTASPESSPAASASPDAPSAPVSRAADLVAAAESFQAVQEYRPTEEAIRQWYPDATDEQVEMHAALGSAVFAYTYTAEPEPVFQQATSADGGAPTYQNIGGDLYVHDFVDDVWTRNPPPDPAQDPDRPDPHDPDRYTVEAFVQPLRAAAEAPDLAVEGEVREDGVPGTLYSGTFAEDGFVSRSGEDITAGTVFELVLDADGYPLRLEYTTDLAEHVLRFESFGDPVTIETPSPEDLAANGGP